MTLIPLSFEMDLSASTMLERTSRASQLGSDVVDDDEDDGWLMFDAAWYVDDLGGGSCRRFGGGMRAFGWPLEGLVTENGARGLGLEDESERLEVEDEGVGGRISTSTWTGDEGEVEEKGGASEREAG